MNVFANGINVHYESAGEAGPWVIFSHSLACNGSMWERQAAALAPTHRVLRYDTRGHGKTEAPGGPYTLDQLAGDVVGLMDALAIDRAHFVGLSMGGMIGQTAALAHPGRFASLTLADTTSRYPAEFMAVWEGRIHQALEQGMESHVEPTLERWFTAGFRAGRPEALPPVAEMIRSTPVAGFVGCCHALSKVNTYPRLEEIRCPVLVMVGEQDPTTPVAMARDIHAAIPGSELVVIPDAAHISNIEQPEAFTSALVRFLSALR